MDETLFPFLIDRYESGTVEMRPFMYSAQASFATALAERWGMVAGIEDGEDSAGRSKLRCMTPQEIADKACETAEAMLAKFRQLGWITARKPVYDLAKAKREEADAEREKKRAEALAAAQKA